jgi:hypothetical protein
VLVPVVVQIVSGTSILQPALEDRGFSGRMGLAAEPDGRESAQGEEKGQNHDLGE